MADLEGFLRFARANDETDQALALLHLTAAIRELEEAGVPERHGDMLYDLAVYQLGTYRMDYAGAIDDTGKSTGIPAGLQGIVHALR
jgi:hypothetical protein